MNKIKELYCGKHLNLVEIDGWEYVTRNYHDVAIIMPVFGDGDILLISEFRQPLQKRVIGLPAGIVGDHGEIESIYDGAKRELVEETGYTGELELVLENSPSSSGITNEVFNLFIARNLVKVGDGGGDETEDIEVIRVNPKNLSSLVLEWKKSGHIIDPKIYVGLHFLSLK